MNPIQVLGKQFDSISSEIKCSGVLEVFEDHDPEEGTPQEYYVSASDESWEFSLDRENRISAIFLYLSNGYESFNEISHKTTKEDVLNKFGEPDHQGIEKELAFLGRKGAWESYNLGSYVMHIEHTVGQDTIDKITLSLPDGQQ